MRPAWVYRVWDGRCLVYVGMGMDPSTRYHEHSRRSWWPMDAVMTVEGPYERADAVVREQQVIAAEVPVMNGRAYPRSER